MRQEIEEWLEPLDQETIFFEGLDMAIIGATEVPEGIRFATISVAFWSSLSFLA